MENQVTTMKEKSPAEQALLKAVEQAVTAGNLAMLNPEQRLFYYNQVCASAGLNPLTRPFDFITLNGKLVLYAKKDATDQLRKIHKVSITKIEREIVGDKGQEQLIVTAHAKDDQGKEDCDVGALPLPVAGEPRSNAIMKGITKAKRRVTLSICGLGLLDESELETIPEAKAQMAEKTATQTEGLKEKFTAPKEPEILPPAEKPKAKSKMRPDGAKVQETPKANPAPKNTPPPVPAAAKEQPANYGATVVPFGMYNGKKLDELDDKQLREVIVATKKGIEVEKWTGPRLLAFADQLNEYAAGVDLGAPAFENTEDPAAFFEEPGFDEPAVDPKKIALDRLKAAKSMDELKKAWTQLFADAKDETKINLKALSPEDQQTFNSAAIKIRDEMKAKLK